MSIINDALKKTQQHMKNLESTNIPDTASSTETITPKPIQPEGKNNYQGLLYLLSVCIILMLGLTIYNTFFPKTFAQSKIAIKIPNINPEKINNTALPAEVKNPTAAETAPKPPTSAPEAESAPKFKLNGIMSVGNQMAALINDEVYEVGAEIDGYTITAIDLKSVKLMKDDEELILK